MHEVVVVVVVAIRTRHVRRSPALLFVFLRRVVLSATTLAGVLHFKKVSDPLCSTRDNSRARARASTPSVAEKKASR